MLNTFLRYSLPEGLDALVELALDLRWTWSHEADQLWRTINPEAWARTRNPWLMLQSISRVELEELALDEKFREELERLMAARQEYYKRPGWFSENHDPQTLGAVAYFSMEFGIGEALPFYAGGLGILAGDYLKTASDLRVPVTGIGLLYQQGYFRQMLNATGWQSETYPYNDPSGLPIRTASNASGGWLRVPLELPGRTLWLRVWQAQIGNTILYLLDSNDPLNTPADRSITGKLYDDRHEIRLVQEMALGIGGWRALDALGIAPDVCHLNEGHTAFAAVERARRFMQQSGEPFSVALAATSAGNVFTTHTPVGAGFDAFPRQLISRYFNDYLRSADIPLETFLALGRADPGNREEPFNTAYLAARTTCCINAVSRLHAQVTRRIFQVLYPRWPEDEVPVDFITNGIHVPSWDSEFADKLWTDTCQKERWLHALENLAESIQDLSDQEIWEFRMRESSELVDFVRQRLEYQLRHEDTDPERLKEARLCLDCNVFTMGFARRFTGYKRPNLLLTDPERLAAIINSARRPVQLIVAGKAHPEDLEGKMMVQQFVTFANRADVRRRVVFLEDYDMGIAQQLVQGIDLWLNTPKRPWEACGTSGMKILVNGGLNFSELDGWWAEAYSPEVGWALGNGEEHSEPGWDDVEARQLYETLENEIIPEFYARDAQGIPVGWVRRMRASMAQLAPRFSSNRMLREYVDRMYIPAAASYRQRIANGALQAKQISSWHAALDEKWFEVRFGEVDVSTENNRHSFAVPVYFGELDPSLSAVELYAPSDNGAKAFHAPMVRSEKLPGALNGYVYRGEAPASRPPEYYTPRVIPALPEAKVPLEESHILWQR